MSFKKACMTVPVVFLSAQLVLNGCKPALQKSSQKSFQSSTSSDLLLEEWLPDASNAALKSSEIGDFKNICYFKIKNNADLDPQIPSNRTVLMKSVLDDFGSTGSGNGTAPDFLVTSYALSLNDIISAIQVNGDLANDAQVQKQVQSLKTLAAGASAAASAYVGLSLSATQSEIQIRPNDFTSATIGSTLGKVSGPLTVQDVFNQMTENKNNLLNRLSALEANPSGVSTAQQQDGIAEMKRLIDKLNEQESIFKDFINKGHGNLPVDSDAFRALVKPIKMSIIAKEPTAEATLKKLGEAIPETYTGIAKDVHAAETIGAKPISESTKVFQARPALVEEINNYTTKLRSLETAEPLFAKAAQGYITKDMTRAAPDAKTAERLELLKTRSVKIRAEINRTKQLIKNRNATLELLNELIQKKQGNIALNSEEFYQILRDKDRAGWANWKGDPVAGKSPSEIADKMLNGTTDLEKATKTAVEDIGSKKFCRGTGLEIVGCSFLAAGTLLGVAAYADNQNAQKKNANRASMNLAGDNSNAAGTDSVSSLQAKLNACAIISNPNLFSKN